ARCAMRNPRLPTQCQPRSLPAMVRTRPTTTNAATPTCRTRTTSARLCATEGSSGIGGRPRRWPKTVRDLLDRGSRSGPTGLKEGQSRRRHLYASFAARLMAALDEAACVRFLPDRKSRTRGTPDLDDFRVGAGSAPYPF